MQYVSVCFVCCRLLMNETFGLRSSFLNLQSCNNLLELSVGPWRSTDQGCEVPSSLAQCHVWAQTLLPDGGCVVVPLFRLWSSRTRKSVATSATFHHHSEPLACMPRPFPAPCPYCPSQSPTTALKSQCVPSPTHCDRDPPVLCLQSNLGDGAISHKAQPVFAEDRRVGSSLLIAYLSAL